MSILGLNLESVTVRQTRLACLNTPFTVTLIGLGILIDRSARLVTKRVRKGATETNHAQFGGCIGHEASVVPPSVGSCKEAQVA